MHTRVAAAADTRTYPGRSRRAWVLRRLAACDGPRYDELVAEVAAAFPAPGTRNWTSIRAARAVRRVLWDELAATRADERVLLTLAGWRALEAMGATAGVQ